ncbi:MAG: 3'(2'),5'-bisphosphate nucleotidase CysQ [Pseudomonadota bacterium]
MPADDLTLLVEAAEAAGEIALKHRHNETLNTTEKPDGQGPVTAADLEIDAMLRARLTSARPGYGWLSEESSDDGTRLSASQTFIVDPIDGTRAYIEGGRGFCHALAVVDAEGVSAAAAHFPVLKRTYAAARGHGATLNGAPIHAQEPCATPPDVLITRNMLESFHWPGGTPRVNRAYRPSLIARLCYVAEGRFAASLTFRQSWEWDVAAGSLILSEAGATITDGHGAPLRYNQPDPRHPGLIAAAPGYHAELLSHRLG